MDPLSTHTRTSPFPPDAAAWLAGQSGRTVVLVGEPRCTAPIAGALGALGYDVRSSVDGTMSLPDRSVDAIVAMEFAPDLEIAARVLRPGGQVAVLTQEHDTRIPWVRKLRAALRLPAPADPAGALSGSPYFGAVVTETFRHWEVVTRDALSEVVRALPAVLTRGHSEQEKAVAAATGLYDDYGRGPDGMQLPWISHCHRVPVSSEAWAMVTERARAAAELAEAEEAAARAAARAEAEQPDVPRGPVDPIDLVAQQSLADPEAAADSSVETGAQAGSGQPAPPPRPQFDLGDTAEGIITYVVDTGELPPVRAPLRPKAVEPEPDDEPDDPDLLIRFR